MSQQVKESIENPLETEPIKQLLFEFAVPSIIAMLVSSLYNIVDQFFIGHSVGELGNAATNISYPLSISCVAIALLFGIGGASAFNISMGKKEQEKAVYYLGNSTVMLFGCGLALCLFTLLFLEPLLHFFGSPDNVLEYAKTYTGIVAFGFPFLILTAVQLINVNSKMRKIEIIFKAKKAHLPLGENIIFSKDIDSLDLQYFMRLYRYAQIKWRISL